MMNRFINISFGGRRDSSLVMNNRLGYLFTSSPTLGAIKGREGGPYITVGGNLRLRAYTFQYQIADLAQKLGVVRLGAALRTWIGSDQFYFTCTPEIYKALLHFWVSRALSENPSSGRLSERQRQEIANLYWGRDASLLSIREFVNAEVTKILKEIMEAEARARIAEETISPEIRAQEIQAAVQAEVREKMELRETRWEEEQRRLRESKIREEKLNIFRRFVSYSERARQDFREEWLRKVAIFDRAFKNGTDKQLEYEIPEDLEPATQTLKENLSAVATDVKRDMDSFLRLRITRLGDRRTQSVEEAKRAEWLVV